MAKSTQQFLCTACGEVFGKWSGKCDSCGAWNTIQEFHEAKLASSAGGKISRGQNLTRQKSETETKKVPPERIPTGISEVDRVLGGGFFPGSLVLFGGAPGVGKSTLAIQMFLRFPAAHYFSGEESVDQVWHRADRVTKISDKSKHHIFSTHALEDICETIEKERPPFAVVDSVQMIGRADASLGHLAQLRENAEVLLRLAKATGTVILLIGHVTKDEELAGPKILEHIVDVVLRLEGDNMSEVRILRSPKNRFGSTLEVGVFEMRGVGLAELKNPSEFFLAERAENGSGSVISVIREGARNFLLEIQVLTVKTNFGQPRRTANGVPLSKFHLLLAVISKFTPFKCAEFDAYANVVGGLRVQEPAADLAICAAILSSRLEKEIAADTVVIGEVGLAGEVRSVGNLEARLAEAAKLGFKKAIVPRIREKFVPPQGLKIYEARSVLDLAKALFEK